MFKKRTALVKFIKPCIISETEKNAIYLSANLILAKDRLIVSRLTTRLVRYEIPHASKQLNDETWCLFVGDEPNPKEILELCALKGIKTSTFWPFQMIYWAIQNSSGLILPSQSEVNATQKTCAKYFPEHYINYQTIGNNIYVGILASTKKQHYYFNKSYAFKDDYMRMLFKRNSIFCIRETVDLNYLREYLTNLGIHYSIDSSDFTIGNFHKLTINNE